MTQKLESLHAVLHYVAKQDFTIAKKNLCAILGAISLRME